MALIRKLAKYHREAYRMGHFPPSGSLVSGKKKFAYYGFLGDGNYGDELVYEATRHIFRSDVLIPVRRFMPLEFALFAKLFPGKFSGIVIGGGTLVGPSFYEKKHYIDLAASGKTIYMHGTGVYRVSAWNEGWKTLLQHPIYGGLRGPDSVKTFSEFKAASVQAAGDAAFALFDRGTVRDPKTRSNIVLINRGTHKAFDGLENSRNAFDAFLGRLTESGAQLHFLPCHDIDIELGRQLQERFPAIKLLPIPRNYAEAKQRFVGAAFAVGERLHFVATAMLTGCPFLSINYALKHVDMLASVGLPHAGVLPQDLTLERLEMAWGQRDSFEWEEAFRAMEAFQAFQLQQLAVFRAQ